MPATRNPNKSGLRLRLSPQSKTRNPQPETMQSQTAFLILSCDAYSGLWETHFRCLDKYWPDCPFPKYLLSNYKVSNHAEITTLKAGKDISWSANLKHALGELEKDYKYIIATFDDLFLTQKVDTQELAKVVESFKAEKGQFLQLIKWHNKPKKINQHIGLLEKGSLYRPNCVYALWDIEVLNELLVTEESAWDFERIGTKRSDKFDGFYAVYQSIFQYRNVVIRGKVVRKDAHNFGLKTLNNLRVMSLFDSIRFYTRYWSFKFFLFVVPRKYQARVARVKTSFIK